ncbi:MAG: hypothetical protein ACKOVB_23745 [Terrabacter sp.]
MPVDDRLRQGLEANATSFVPAGEWRLALVRRRRRRRTTNVVASLTTTGAVMAAAAVLQLGGTVPWGPAPPADGPRPSGSSLAQREAEVPLGGWMHQVTARRGLELGISRRRVERLTGEDGLLELGLKMEQQIFTIYTNDDEGRYTAWDTGRYAFASGHRLALTSMTSACPGCVTRLTWRQLGRDVAFASVTRDRAGLLARWFYEGRWNYG